MSNVDQCGDDGSGEVLKLFFFFWPDKDSFERRQIYVENHEKSSAAIWLKKLSTASSVVRACDASDVDVDVNNVDVDNYDDNTDD